MAGTADAALLARARALVPLLAARATMVTAARQVADETIAAFHQTGILRVLQPSRYGGCQTSFATFLDILDILTEGCASSAWVYAILGELQWVIASLPERAQEEIWGTDPKAVAAGSIVPRALAHRCDGGWRISARYPFGSGCLHAQWTFIAARCETANGQEPVRYLALPMTDVEIVDDWYALGMRGTGSRTLVLRDVFVPEHRTIALTDILAGTPPGRYVHPEYALLRAPRYYLVPFVLPAVAFGLARTALRLVTESLAARAGAPSDVLHFRLGEAAARVETANLIFATRRTQSIARLESGEPIDDADVARNRRDVTFAFRSLREGVEQLAGLNGARSVYDDDPLQSVLRDVTTIATHIVLNEEMAMVPFGRLMLDRAAGRR
jgi:3-hydroxy-9,10-secoandrosta-1,3,5(10)-triene-9,17-dione monooxygenase